MIRSSFRQHSGILKEDIGKDNDLTVTVDAWLEKKQSVEGAEGLWRVHDKLYDLSSWIKDHPGGSHWLQITKGTDVTEAFECNHISSKAEKYLQKFYVRPAKTPRNSLITFHENGFYKTLKKKINDRKLLEWKSTTPQNETMLLADSLAVMMLLTGFLGTIGNYWLLFVSGLFLSMLAVCAHNFFHMRDNWRMYYFQLSLMSVREWRVSHALSHHLYPNTSLDLEISMLSPILRFLPRPNKKYVFLTLGLSMLTTAFFAHAQFVRRIIKKIYTLKLDYLGDEVVPFLFLVFLYVTGRQGFWTTFVFWNIILATGSFAFVFVGLVAAHHHPDIYHDGDFLGNDRDFGVLQLAAVRGRISVDKNFFLRLTMFGEHALHHLFPTVDHSKLPLLNTTFEETCKEFNLNFKPYKMKSLVLGMFQQLIRNYTNNELKIYSK